MYSGDIIVHTENHKESTKILWEMISKYTHVFGYDFNIWMSITFLQTINEQFEFEMKKNTIQLTLAIKIKHSGMNLAKYVQVIYEENHKNMKKSKNK